jgi:Fe-Mn family superoxide dismutase
MMDRRTALKHLGGVASALLLTESLSGQALPAGQPTASTPPPTGPFTLPPLPYAYDALEPHFDAETMHLHHDKHHQAYVNNLNAAVAAHPELAGKTVDELVASLSALPESARTAVRNNGGGHANHSFWWPTLGKPGSATAPTGELAKAVDLKFGSLSAFEDKLTAAALSVFGSGWAWLVKLPDGAVAIETTPNQDSPLTLGHKPVLTVDVWEHAYYLKYQNLRAKYLESWWNVVNWHEVNRRFAIAKG